MTEQEILEGNKLIAEFMGCIVARYYTDLYIMTYMEQTPHFNAADMKYHTSWDWLMPVIQKTIALNLKLEIPQKRPDQSLVYAEIRIAWHEVVEFIKEYNSNK